MKGVRRRTTMINHLRALPKNFRTSAVFCDSQFRRFVGHGLFLLVVLTVASGQYGGPSNSLNLPLPWSCEDRTSTSAAIDPASPPEDREADSSEHAESLHLGYDLMDRWIARAIRDRQSLRLTLDELKKPVDPDQQMWAWMGWKPCRLHRSAHPVSCRLRHLSNEGPFAPEYAGSGPRRGLGLPPALACIQKLVLRFNQALVIKENRRKIVIDAVNSRMHLAVHF